MAMKYSLSSHVTTERYDAILRAAERLFGEKGYHTTSIEEIAKTAGVSRGLVHYHFASKEELLNRLLKDEMAALFNRLDAIAQSDETGRAKIWAAVETYLSVASSRPDLARIVLPDASLGESTRALIIVFKEENLLRIAGVVEEGIAKREFKPVDSRLVAILITGMVLEVIAEASVQRRQLRLQKTADDITGILCDGISS